MWDDGHKYDLVFFRSSSSYIAPILNNSDEYIERKYPQKCQIKRTDTILIASRKVLIILKKKSLTHQDQSVKQIFVRKIHYILSNSYYYE
ncbi:unnamed protein product [Rotaria sordida]|uniref:Uncharacterized protein n=1 Tax=Rotaria sordida TaxID=392033 RepID=A0A814KET6_9BILA|nr:unnamed protein product [Rotaria sordida]